MSNLNKENIELYKISLVAEYMAIEYKLYIIITASFT